MSSLSMPSPEPAKAVSVEDAVVTVIRPQRGLATLDLKGLWYRRELAWVLAMRDLRVRYKQTLLGVSWAVVQPLATMVVLHVFFGKVMGMAERVGDVPYPVFLYAGLLPWTLFSNAVTASSNSLVGNAHILSKVYFPRLLLPLSSVVVPVIDYMIAFAVLAGLMLYFQVSLTWGLLWLIPLIASTLLAVLGVGITLASLTVSYRDFRFVVPFMIQLWFFMTPVIYDLTFVPERFHWLVNLNPMAGTIEAFRAVVLGQPIAFGPWLMSASTACLMLLVGLFWFARLERRFADVV
ncbi:MAG: ABC transporter permease [Phycisphaeraceae bacterium]